ncbi:me53 [Catopsilia pomona nucleopolyhedrovirus]|uniref:Me53 n=1 Tax=Catopsilia pomona nucleopolyhedrovirus TaxID=1850906 RepID=A0A172WZ90_9ABAC|nr:me53 [Catopsilia pomona nucleopolyhedrovirus]ANF29666.1 me53 [Catopsilia pomona nucleopolyhedrovirus]
MDNFFRKNNIFKPLPLSSLSKKANVSGNETRSTFDMLQLSNSIGGISVVNSNAGVSPLEEQQDIQRRRRALANSKMPTPSPIGRVIVRGKNENNPVHAIYVCPEYGEQFDKQIAHTKRLDYYRERDIRDHFLSDIERDVMLATLKFATNYVQGFINSKDMRLTGRNDKFKFKSKLEYVAETCCTVCKYKFKENTRMWFLYVVVNKNMPTNDPERFDFCCNECFPKMGDALNTYELYPKFHLIDVHALSREGFFNHYIFPFDVSYVNFYKKEFQITDHNGDVFELIKNLLMYHKKYNENILNIELATVAGLVLKESYTSVLIQRYRHMINAYKPTTIDDVDCFIAEGSSEMAHALKTRMFYNIKGTVFATVSVRAHKELPQLYSGNGGNVITFPVRPVANNYCKLCKKTKMHYRHPVLYCTKCGFTNRYHFGDKYKNCTYNSSVVKSYEAHNEMILFYDINEHKKLNAIET